MTINNCFKKIFILLLLNRPVLYKVIKKDSLHSKVVHKMDLIKANGTAKI